MKIYVDADACPVKQEVERVATRNKLEVFLVSNGGVRPSLNPLIQSIFVSADADAADKWIVDHGDINDLVITSDIILADNCIKKGMRVLKPNGEELNSTNIGNSLQTCNCKTKIQEKHMFSPEFPICNWDDCDHHVKIISEPQD